MSQEKENTVNTINDDNNETTFGLIDAVKNYQSDNKAIVEVEWNGLKFLVKRWLSLEEMLGFVTAVTESCFVGDSRLYTPEALSFATQDAIITFYTNIERPSDTTEKYLVYTAANADDAGLFDAIIECVDSRQFASINKGIKDKIDAMFKINFASISKGLDALKGLGEMIEGFDEEQLSKLLSSLGQ